MDNAIRDVMTDSMGVCAIRSVRITVSKAFVKEMANAGEVWALDAWRDFTDSIAARFARDFALITRAIEMRGSARNAEKLLPSRRHCVRQQVCNLHVHWI